MSWFDFAVKILGLSDLSDVALTPRTTAEFPLPAHRPTYSPLENERFINVGYKLLRPCGEALSEYMKGIILAGGTATRLFPATKAMSKQLLSAI